ncbi:uncharacterized protein LOC130731814 [Lotus japonicus]|uniref:uncharacterized protein LOC130731814 n=1 Tax=Lotus japonicus TaxID=34305 RepID=UPI002587446B|nr:uncharacterized protein LOC130731814 [Lotus japonicus]
MTIVLFLLVSLCVHCYDVDGGKIYQPNQQQIHRLHDYQSIQPSIDDNFDCVDIYKQPAFQHLLLKNHKIQLFPTFMRTTMQNRSSIKDKHFIKGCRSGRVPIFKTTRRQKMTSQTSSKSQLDDFNQYSQGYPRHHVSLFN